MRGCLAAAPELHCCRPLPLPLAHSLPALGTPTPSPKRAPPPPAGVVVALEKLEANFKGLAGRNPNAEGNAVRRR